MASRKERVAIVSAVASGSLAVAKFAVGVFIGSLALISDALHSFIDLGATLVTWYAVRVGDRPPDEEHHYGHGKVESLAALAQTALLFLVAGGVAVEAVSRLRLGGTAVAFSPIPFLVLGIEMAINGWRARVLLATARDTRSQALEADSLHFASDFFGSIPVIVGLALAAFGYDWADPIAALAVAMIISVLGIRLGRRTIESLLDTAPAGMADKLHGILRKIPGIVEVERLRLRNAGALNFVDVAVRVPRTWPIDRVAAVKSEIQDAIEEALAGADVTVTATPIALDDETVLERAMVIARSRSLAVHHVTIHKIEERLALSLDLEVDGSMSLAKAHEIATALENALQEELGRGVEVETHIEPLQADGLTGKDASAERVACVRDALSEIAAEVGPIRDVHDVRVRVTPTGEIVNFHCRVDAILTVHAVHENVDTVERKLRQRWPVIQRVIGHAEPAS